jgi:hypothetical protein
MPEPKEDSTTAIPFVQFILATLERMPLLRQCGYQHPPTSCGACNGWQCGEVAIVHNRPAEQDVCLRHHRLLQERGY